MMSGSLSSLLQGEGGDSFSYCKIGSVPFYRINGNGVDPQHNPFCEIIEKTGAGECGYKREQISSTG